jgi:hypothetical protein
VTAVLVEVGRSCGGCSCRELALAGSSRPLTCIETQVHFCISRFCFMAKTLVGRLNIVSRKISGSGSAAPVPYIS